MIVALVIVVGVVAVIAFQQRDGDADATPAQSVPTAEWFDERTEQACPVVQAWFGALVAAVTAVQEGRPWPEMQSALATANQDAEDRYRELRRLANDRGEHELRYLVAVQQRAKDAAEGSATLPEFAQELQALGSRRLSRDVLSLIDVADKCSNPQ
jgi:hypothetical protein